jgi:phosphoserine phosphatase
MSILCPIGTNSLRRIAGVEKEIGAGLIEEVIQVAEGELKLVDEMAKSQVYVTLFTSGPRFQAPVADLGVTDGRSSQRNLDQDNGHILNGRLATHRVFSFS